MIWFTSDLHLGHEAIIRMCGRPFETVEQMNEILIENFNKKVKKNDTVYILGDLAFKMKVADVNELLLQMNGKKYLCIGNHDKQYDSKLFEEVKEFMQVHLNGESISLMHYPMLQWPNSRRGSIHLHGHLHSSREYNLKQREMGIHRYDVGVDANDFSPVSLQDILEFFEREKQMMR